MSQFTKNCSSYKERNVNQLKTDISNQVSNVVYHGERDV